jgi:eukaryotic-like serine/threonine-protein kinase
MTLREGAIVRQGLRLVRPLQEGAMGSLWVAQDEGLGHQVAVKFIARELLRDDTALKRFERESRLAERLRSPHVPVGYGRGETQDGTPYLVMELLAGETLEQRLARAGRLEHDEVVTILDQAARALDEAHELGIVHRDIKPANIFLEEGARTQVKVLDFGMAKRVDAVDPTVVTEAGRAVGTPDYMSPEQLREARKVDYRADLWALAVVAYRAITGRLPFVSGSFAGLCMAICTGRYTPASDVDPHLPRALDAWFERALNLERDRRFGSASETVDALRMALATSRRHRLRVAVAVVLVVLAAMVAIVARWWG